MKKKYYDDAAMHLMALDLIYKFRNRGIKSYDETNLFSHVTDIYIGNENWVFSIDMNLLDIDNTIEIIAVRRDENIGKDNIRIHLKGSQWFDNIDNIEDNESKRNAIVASKVVKYMKAYIKDIYKDKSKEYSAILPELYASDFE